MLIVLGDLIADLFLRIPAFPVTAQQLTPLTHLDLGPGGAGNIAIVAARLGMPVACLGEVGADRMGRIVRDGLAKEGVDLSGVLTTARSITPVAGVLVDTGGEPAYLGFSGHLTLSALPAAWRAAITGASAFFVDGWVENEQWPGIILDGLRAAREAGVPAFFDPGPGNPAFDNGWHREAAALATAVLANEAEAERLTGAADSFRAAATMLDQGAELVVIKRGAGGLLARNQTEIVEVDGYPVPVRDTTGAGDSLAAAVIYGRLQGLPLPALARLGNATGAAKVQKLGTGHNLPTRTEVMAMLARFAPEVAARLEGGGW